MLTIEGLQALGVNTQEGLERCLNNEAFYFRLVTKALEDDHVERLQAAIDANDLDTAFELVHALKGVFGNLALTPLFDIVNEMTERLRNREQIDYTDYLTAISEKKAALLKLCHD